MCGWCKQVEYKENEEKDTSKIWFKREAIPLLKIERQNERDQRCAYLVWRIERQSQRDRSLSGVKDGDV